MPRFLSSFGSLRSCDDATGISTDCSRSSNSSVIDQPTPPLPEWLEPDYRRAWVEVLEIALLDLGSTEFSRDSVTIREILAVVALAKGCLALGAVLSILDDQEVTEYLENHRSWSNYRSK
jgi:hypothetical protein